jgi:Helix-turn-helix domain
MARTALSAEEVDEVWRRWRSGEAVKVLARAMRRHPSTVRDLLKRCGGVRPARRRRGELRLSLAEREEISRGLAAGRSLRAIAAGLGRAPSTVSREVTNNEGRQDYRALHADAAAWTRACRPKATKLSRRPGLRSMVEEKLALRWSPEQISGWLRRRFPTGVEMHVSHETIYRSLFVQSRGDLRHELTRYLRTKRAMRRPKGARLPDGRGARLYELSIADRPAEAADRAVPGHWEGDLVFAPRPDRDRHIGGTRDPLRDADRVARRAQGRAGRRRPGREHPDPAPSAGPVADLGPGQRDGRTSALQRRHRRGRVLLRSEESLAARQQ